MHLLRYTLLAYVIFVTSNMNILQPKVSLLKDITLEYASSMKSAGNVRSQCENFLNSLEYQLAMRMNERNRLITKVGITLRDLLLDDYRSLISKMHMEFCRREEVFLWMTEQYESLQDTINNTEFSIQELKKIRKWSFEEFNYNQLIQNKSLAQRFSFNKENFQGQSNIISKNYTQRNQWKLEDNINEKKYKKDWLRVKLSSKQRREQLICMQKKLEQAEIAEISDIIDECLESLTDFSFFKNSKKFKEIKLSESYSNHTNPEPENNQNNPSNGVSLGIESLNDDVSLLCNQLIEDFNASKGSALQRITEREDEELESQSSPTPQKRLTESTD